MAEHLSKQCEDAHALRMAGRLVESEAAYRRILAVAPQYQDAAVSLAFMLRGQGRLDAAATAVLAFWRAAPRSRSGDLKAINFLIETGRHALAVEPADASVLAFPADAAVQELAGVVSQATGNFPQAGERFRAAVDLDPSRAAAWLRLASTRRFESLRDPDFERMQRTVMRREISRNAYVCLSFAMAKAYDDVCERASATAAWRRGNAAVAATGIPATARVLADPSARWRGLPIPVPARGSPLFVVGLPRSGTTLLAELLSRHPRVRNRGELGWLPVIEKELGTDPVLTALQRARGLYLSQLLQDDAPASWYVDKNPLNYRHLATVLQLFPEARVVHVTRSPRDVALSLWSQHFAHPDMGWSYRFGIIAEEMERYRTCVVEAMQWFPRGQWQEIDYATLVMDTDRVVDRLLTWLGLRSNEVAAARGAIATASVWQARQPVYRTSVERWRHYRDHVPELLRFQERF